jgi:hypothetical protein
MLQFRDSVLACTRVDRDSDQKIGTRVQMVEKAEVCGVDCCESATPAGKNLSSRWFTHNCIVNVARRAASFTWMECQLGNVGSDRQLGNNNERG